MDIYTLLDDTICGSVTLGFASSNSITQSLQEGKIVISVVRVCASFWGKRDKKQSW